MIFFIDTEKAFDKIPVLTHDSIDIEGYFHKMMNCTCIP